MADYETSLRLAHLTLREEQVLRMKRGLYGKPMSINAIAKYHQAGWQNVKNIYDRACKKVNVYG